MWPHGTTCAYTFILDSCRSLTARIIVKVFKDDGESFDYGLQIQGQTVKVMP